MNVFPSSPAPAYPLNLKPGWKTNITDYESGKEQRNSRWTFPKRTLNLRFKGITQSQVDTLLNFFNGQKGAYDPFWFFMPNKKQDGSWPSYQGEYVGRGNGTATIFELPSKETTGLTVYLSGIVTPATFLSGGGDAGVDRIQFNATGNISSSSVANPTVITTTAAHGLTTGNKVTIAGHTGSTPSINGSHTVTVLSPTTFSIPVNVTVGGTGGTWTIDPPVNGSFLSADFTGQLRLRCRFLEDEMDAELFTWVLFNTGLNLKEVRA